MRARPVRYIASAGRHAAPVALASAGAGVLWAVVEVVDASTVSMTPPLVRLGALVGHAALLGTAMIIVGGLFGGIVEVSRTTLLGVNHRLFRRALTLRTVVGAVLFGLVQTPALVWLWDRPALASLASKVSAVVCVAVSSLLLAWIVGAAWEERRDVRRLAVVLGGFAGLVLFAVAHQRLVRPYDVLSLTAMLLGLFTVGATVGASLSRGFGVRRAAWALLCTFGIAGAIAVVSVRDARVRNAIATEAVGGGDLLNLARALHLWKRSPLQLPREVSPGKTASSSRLVVPNAGVVIITIDSLRADRLPAYGGTPGLTPNLDRFFATAVLCDRAYSQYPATTGSLPSLHSGVFPWDASAGWRDVLSRRSTVAKRLGARGYDTAAFFGRWSLSDDAGYFYMDHVRFGFEKGSSTIATGTRRIQGGLDFLEHAARPFLWVHIMEPHDPYERHSELQNGPTDPYDNEIAYADTILGPLLDFVARRKDLIVWLTADHGEAFGEHGHHFHASSLYDEQIRVPLAVRIPGLAPRRVPGPIQVLDIAPTTLALVGADMRDLDGYDRRADLEGAPSTGPAFAAFERSIMIATDESKLICDAGSDSCEFYDLTEDPGERANHYGQRDERERSLWDTLLRFVASPGITSMDEHVTLERLLLVRRIVEHRMSSPSDVLGLLASEDALERLVAVRALARSPPMAARVRDALARLRDDTVAAVRCWALVALARTGAREAAARLADCEPPMRANADSRAWLALARYEIDGNTARSTLQSILHAEKDSELAHATISAIHRFNDGRWRPDLIGWLEDADLAELAGATLLSLDPDGGLRAVAHALEETNSPEAQIALVRALAATRKPATYDALAAVARSSSDWAVRGEAALALHELGRDATDIGGAASSFDFLPDQKVYRGSLVMPELTDGWTHCWVGVTQPAEDQPPLGIRVNGKLIGEHVPSVPALWFRVERDVLRAGVNTLDISFAGDVLPVRGVAITFQKKKATP